MCEMAAQDNAKIQTDFEHALSKSQTMTQNGVPGSDNLYHQAAAEILNKTTATMSILN